MAQNCTVDADCQPLLTLAGWCASGVQCWTDTGTCIVWPRCRAAPYLGCVPSEEACANVRVEEPSPDVVTGLEVGLFFVLLVALAGSLLIFAVIFYVLWSKKQQPDDEEHWQNRILPAPVSLGSLVDSEARRPARVDDQRKMDTNEETNATMDPFVF